MRPTRNQLIRIAYHRPDLRASVLTILGVGNHKCAAGIQKVLAVKDLPTPIKKAFKEIGYGGRDIQVEVSPTFTPRSAAFDGSRSVVVLVSLADGKTHIEHGAWGGATPFDPKRVDNVSEKTRIPAGFVVIVGSMGGRGNFLTLIVPPENVAKLLETEELIDLSEEEKKVLYLFHGIKSGYRAEEMRRHGYGRYEAGNPTIRSLIDKGLVTINAKGSMKISLKGKNALIEHNVKSYR